MFPIIHRLLNEGYRVWYDEGIDPGTEWEDVIAEHIDGCTCFIACLSDNYLSSSNCKEELSFARELEKSRILIYLEDVELPKGMKMRLSRIQSIHRHTYLNEEDFLKKLIQAENLNLCREIGMG